MLIIEPGFSEPSVANMIELMRVNSTRIVNVQIRDADGNLVDIDEGVQPSGAPTGALDLEVTNLGGTVILSDSYWPKPDPPESRRIYKVSTGVYAIEITSDDISSAGRYLFNWHARVNETSEDAYRTQVIEVVSPRVLSVLPSFRLLIDKSLKRTIPEEYCYLGYTDSQLVLYLMQGLSYINAMPPYPVWTSLEDYPIENYMDTLIRSSLYIGITSQSLFSIDTDIPSYSDQGHSFALTHFQPLNALMSHLRAELDKMIPDLKRKFVRSGSASVETRLGYLWYNMIASAPAGALFRNYYYIP